MTMFILIVKKWFLEKIIIRMFAFVMTADEMHLMQASYPIDAGPN